MNQAAKIGLYVVLFIAAGFFGQRFLGTYNTRMETASARRLQVTELAGGTTNASPAGVEGAAEGGTNAPAEPGEGQGQGEAGAVEEGEGGSTNAVTAAEGGSGGKPEVKARNEGSGGGQGARLGLYGAVALGCVLVLGLMVAYDLSHYIAARAHGEIYNEEGEGFADTGYDEAEQVWANGDHLEAIRLFREYWLAHPRQIHVAFRIAEIYEKDLSNNLAAALEYEEILTRKLSAERWGWAAIHLCNLYGRLNQPAKVEGLLQRIVAEYGQTAAAKKARERLGLPEPGEGGGEADDGGPKLPPGFRLKK